MDFSDVVIRILFAGLLGGSIGLEREFRDKSAGFRTMILISVGSALFTILALSIADQVAESDPTRIISYILSGIGFLGAGVIIKDGSSVKGLTTAATIWLSAALGLGVGAGFFLISAFTAAVILFALIVLPHVEYWIDHRHEFRVYEIELSSKADFNKVADLFAKTDLKIYRARRGKKGSSYHLSVNADGHTTQHSEVVDLLLESSFVKSF